MRSVGQISVLGGRYRALGGGFFTSPPKRGIGHESPNPWGGGGLRSLARLASGARRPRVGPGPGPADPARAFRYAPRPMDALPWCEAFDAGVRSGGVVAVGPGADGCGSVLG